MTNLNKPYTKHRRNDGRTLEYTVYNRSTDAVIKTGRSKLLTKEGVIDVIRDEVQMGLSDDYAAKKQNWHVEIANSKIRNQEVRVRFYSEELL